MKMSRSGTVRNFWTPKEDAVLIREANIQLSKGRLQDWNSIATALPGRSNKDCRKRWVKLSTQANKGPWGAEEDKRLCNSIIQYGQRWTMVAEAVGTRSADQCAKRWQNSLNPELDCSEWQSEDEARLVRAVEIHGRNWKLISEAEFPRRSPTDLKNKYVTFERKRRQRSERSATTASSSSRCSSYSTPTPSLASLSTLSDRFLDHGGSSNNCSPYALSTHTPAHSPQNSLHVPVMGLFDNTHPLAFSPISRTSSSLSAAAVASGGGCAGGTGPGSDTFSYHHHDATPWPASDGSYAMYSSSPFGLQPNNSRTDTYSNNGLHASSCSPSSEFISPNPSSHPNSHSNSISSSYPLYPSSSSSAEHMPLSIPTTVPSPFDYPLPDASSPPDLEPSTATTTAASAASTAIAVTTASANYPRITQQQQQQQHGDDNGARFTDGGGIVGIGIGIGVPDGDGDEGEVGVVGGVGVGFGAGMAMGMSMEDFGRFTLVVENLQEEAASELLHVMACKGLPGDVDVRVLGYQR